MTHAFTGQIAGFAVPDQLDLRDISFGSATTRSFAEAAGNTSGTLTVSDGTHTAHLTLLGLYTTSSFNLTSDGHGGTLVTDPPVAAGGLSQLTFADLAMPTAQNAIGASPQGYSSDPALLSTNQVGAVSLALLPTGQQYGLPPPS